MAAPPATGEWSVTSLLPPNEVDLEFEADGMLATLFTPIADVVANKLVDAFCERMDTVQTGGAHIGRQH